jgi:hypothetical protein
MPLCAICLLVLVGVKGGEDSSYTKCLVTDRCRTCDGVEQKERYCLETGHREEMQCLDTKKTKVVAYDTCEPEESASTSVLEFEVRVFVLTCTLGLIPTSSLFFSRSIASNAGWISPVSIRREGTQKVA